MHQKRAIGGFVSFCGGLVVNIIQATKPHWFGDHAWILPASFVVLFSGLLLWLCQYRWAQKLLGLDQPIASPSVTPSPEVLPSRLNIIEARYGVEGGPDADVLEKYIKPRMRGDAFVGWVGADLFGGFQPVINAPKRLKVRYSFDGIEDTVTRCDNEMLVLPEDRFLKEQLARCAADAEKRIEDLSGAWDKKFSFTISLTELQKEAFQFAEELRFWEASISPLATPPPIAGEAAVDFQIRKAKQTVIYGNKAIYEYGEKFDQKAKSLYRRFAAESIQDDKLAQLLDSGAGTRANEIATRFDALALRQLKPAACSLIWNKGEYAQTN